VNGRQDYYLWRLVGTALSFTLFGAAGLVLGLFVFPLSRLLPLGARRRLAWGRATVTLCFYGFIKVMRSLRVLSYEFNGAERLGRPGQLILANHPSLIDVVFLIGFAPRAGCVVKSALWRNPCTAGVVSAAGYIPNTPTDLMIEQASQALQHDRALIMFPEGTRSTPGTRLQFHRGAASVAIRAASFVTPVYITVEPSTLTKAAPWYRIPARRPHFALTVGEDIDLSQFRRLGAAPLASRALNEALVQRYTQQLAGATAHRVDAR